MDPVKTWSNNNALCPLMLSFSLLNLHPKLKLETLIVISLKCGYFSSLLENSTIANLYLMNQLKGDYWSPVQGITYNLWVQGQTISQRTKIVISEGKWCYIITIHFNLHYKHESDWSNSVDWWGHVASSHATNGYVILLVWNFAKLFKVLAGHSCFQDRLDNSTQECISYNPLMCG